MSESVRNNQQQKLLTALDLFAKKLATGLINRAVAESSKNLALQKQVDTRQNLGNSKNMTGNCNFCLFLSTAKQAIIFRIK